MHEWQNVLKTNIVANHGTQNSIYKTKKIFHSNFVIKEILLYLLVNYVKILHILDYIGLIPSFSW